jgi:Pyruvate/2-oxoglutarate dehydrogenase complex, dehydrogenase (E1) component, eukaryotic type, alpha subunit
LEVTASWAVKFRLGQAWPFADQYLGKSHVTLCYMGDGAVRQGSLHETF